MTTTSPEEIARQINQRMSQASTTHADVPGWLDPVPADLAEAADARDAIWTRLVDLEDEAQEALAAITSADATDAQAIREAARAGKPLPKPIDRETLHRQLAYAYERVLPVFAEHSRANSAIRHALDAQHKTVVTAAVATARAALEEYRAKIAAAEQAAADARDAYGRGIAALNWVSQLEPVRANVQYTAGGDGNVTVTHDKMAASYLHGTCRMLTERGLTLPADQEQATA